MDSQDKQRGPMQALLTIKHHDDGAQSYLLECPHGVTNAAVEAGPPERRQKLIAGLLTSHGTPYGCACAAETDLVDVYPSVESAIAQLRSGPGNGLADLDSAMTADLIEEVELARCSGCDVAIGVMPLRLPPIVEPRHDDRCRRAERESQGRA
jgi:hypothetical protein